MTTYVVVVARDGVAGFLSGRFLALGLEAGSYGVQVSLDLVAEVLRGGLLRVRL